MKLVVGATGQLGGRITLKLLAQGKPVRALIRENSPAVELAKMGLATDPQTILDAGAQGAYGELRDPASLDRACRGIETVVVTANSVQRDFDIENVDLNGIKRLIDAAKSAGVKHFIFTSANGRHPQAPDPVFKTKALVEAYLLESGLPYTILLPNLFMEVWIGMVVGMPLQAGQPVTLVGRGDHKHSFVAIDDVASFAAAAVDNPAALNQEIYIGGPAAYSWSDVVKSVGEAMGQPLPVNYVTPDQPVPVLPEEIGAMLKLLETFESPMEMRETAAAYGVELTPMQVYARRMFGGG